MTLSPADGTSMFCAREGIDHLSVRYGHSAQADKRHQLATHLRDHVRMPVRQLRQALLEEQSNPLDILKEARRQHDIEHGVAERRGKRIAAIGRAVGARGHALRCLGRRKAGAERKPPPMPLAIAHDVRRRRRCAHRQTGSRGRRQSALSSNMSSRPYSSHSRRKDRRKA